MTVQTDSSAQTNSPVESVVASGKNAQPAITKKWSRWQGALVVSAIVLPMALAYGIFKTGFAMPTGTVNKGDLLVPATAITGLTLLDQQGQTVDLLAGKKMWRMVVVANNECDELCIQQLYTSRQVHKRLSEKSVRVERAFLNTSSQYSEQLKATLDADYPRLKQYRVSPAAWSALMAKTSVAEAPLNGHRLYYIDQQGFAMMSYQPTHEGADLLDDIKRLLKYSYEE